MHREDYQSDGHVRLDPLGCLLWWIEIFALPKGQAQKDAFIDWMELQSPGQDITIYEAAWEKIKDVIAPSVDSILSLLSSIGWVTNITEPGLRWAEKKLIHIGALQQSGKGDCALTTLGNDLVAKRIGTAYVNSVATRAEYWMNSNVKLFREDDPGIGSGFFVGERLIVTARHVVSDLGPKLYQIEDQQGNRYSPVQESLHPDEQVDLAVITVEETFCGRPMVIGDEPTIVEELLVFGYPPVAQQDSILMCTRGEVAALTKTNYGRDHEVLLLTALVRPGNSGGPVLGSNGKVVGVITQNLEHKPKSLKDIEESEDGQSVEKMAGIHRQEIEKSIGVATAFKVKYLFDFEEIKSMLD